MAKRRKKSHAWGAFLVFWTILLLMLGCVVCFALYQYAAVYEETRPEKTMDALMAEMSESDWREELAATAGGVSEFEDARTLFDGYFDSAVAGKELSYRRDLSRSDDTQTVFVVYAGRTRLGEVRLVPLREEIRFGFNRTQWQLEAITAEPLTDKLQGLTVQIDAPDGVTPILNGIALGTEKIADPAVELTEVSALEQRFTTARLRMVRYEVGPLYGEITVSSADGEEIAPLGEPEGGVLRYVIMPTETYSFRVEAPEGVEVSVCGAVLGEEQVTQRQSSIFRKLDAYLPDGGYETLLYEYDGLYTQPEVSASFNGRELTPMLSQDGRLIFFYPSDDNISIAMHEAAEGFFNAYMNYTSYKYNGAALQNVVDRILPNTELYSYFKNSYDAMIWASATEMDQKELHIDNFHRVGENCFTCTILYKADFTATQWHGTDSYEREDGYQMVFIRQNDAWLAATMSAFE